MMNFKLSLGFGKASKAASKIMTSGLVLMIAIFAMTFTNSVQAQISTLSTSTAKIEAEQDAVPAIVEALENEISYLRADMESSGTDVRKDSPALTATAWQHAVINGYTNISSNIRDGHGVQQQMLNFLQGNVYNGSDDGAVGAQVKLNNQQRQQLNNIINFVRSWNVNERDISDFTQTLMMIRELKK